ncbi:MAG: sulfatase-like hydrolase/transferase [Gemmatimonadetes bacterium]|jgi:arylsulfatase A-like enzyme|nr:sulfatase-like hydrolase/transferase [Gemmatimonadota bacterium]MBT6145864.1 sulfatase-like hydrolase/transferase [Gemmatimonadota bacterium]MBT7861008.1 sulfatase-like hydrolase/transferase [Gemmatimonadota bacterium]
MNILLITSDQQRWDALGRLNPAIRTPNLDRLAARGILFDRAYTVNPVCTPTRCSMLTGQYPSRHGCFHVGTSLPDGYGPTVADRFTDAGYSTGLLGKAHFKACKDPASLESAPQVHDLDFFGRWQGPYFGFERAELVIGHTSEPHAAGMHYGAWLRARGVDLQTHFDIHDYDHFGPWSLGEEHHGSAWVADRTMAAIDRAQEADKPFFLWASFQDPHNPYVTPEPWASLHDAAHMPDPIEPASNDGKPDFYESLASGCYYGDDEQLQDRAWGDVKIRPTLTDEDIRKLRAVYYGMVSLMDHHIGRLLDRLEADGTIDDTLIIFCSDHGDYLGDHGLWGKGLPTYEAMQRVPLIVSHPACSNPGQTSHALQSLVDIEATCLDVAGLSPSSQSQGISQKSAWIDPAASIRDHCRVEFRPAQSPYKQRTFVESRFKLVIYDTRDYGELYDLDADPYQTMNLYEDSAWRSVRDTLELKYRTPDEEPDLVRERMAVA